MPRSIRSTACSLAIRRSSPHLHEAMEIWYSLVPEIPVQQYYHRVPLNQTYWTNWPSTENPYMPPAPNHVTTSVYIAHMVQPAT